VPPLHVAVTGASGLLGRTLAAHLRGEGHRVTSLVRRPPGADEVRWDPTGAWDAAPLDGVDAVVHLAGEGIAESRWTPERKVAIAASRVDGTRSLVAALGRLPAPPRVLVSASAMGIYGDRGEIALDESTPPGNDWLSEVALGWEGAALAARESGTRVVLTRFGLLLSPEGGALGKMLLPFRLGVGGHLGNGHQWMSWITLRDTARVIATALTDDRYLGAVNVCTPHPVTNREFTRTLGRVLRRPTVAPVPALALKLLFGEMAEATILASQRMVPGRLQALGFRWEDPDLEGALRRLLGRLP
jgi:uncharacterized protein (TIGR01777 family)